jgi:pimeloyl-ACP methyl ester carboxylesterase
MKTTTFNQHKISYNIEGSAGKNVVLLHGFCERKEMWNDLSRELSKEAVILSIDLPGFGDSEFIPGADLMTYADAVRTVLKAENVQEATVIGHSMGGYVCLALLEKYPNLIKAIGLFHSHPYADDEQRKANRLKAAALVREYGSERYIRELFQGLFTEKFKIEYKEQVELFVQHCVQTPAESVIQALLAMRDRPDRTSVLQNFSGKVLFIIGSEDSTISYEKSLMMAALPEQAVVEVLFNCGHMGMLEQPEKSVEILRKFVQLPY